MKYRKAAEKFSPKCKWRNGIRCRVQLLKTYKIVPIQNVLSLYLLANKAIYFQDFFLISQWPNFSVFIKLFNFLPTENWTNKALCS